MITKKEQLQILITNKEIDKALKLAANFTRDFTSDEHRDIQISAECIGNTSRQKFYTQIGHNLTETRKAAEQSLNDWMLKNCKKINIG